MLLAVLLGLRLTLAGRAAAGRFALGVGVLAKIVPVLLAPLLLVWSVRHRRLGATLLGGLAALLVLAFYHWRFFRAPGALEFFRQQSDVVRFTPVWIASGLLGVDVRTALAGGRAVAVAVLAAAAVRLWRRPEPSVLVQACAATLAGLICFGLASFGPWYHVWWTPLALLAGGGYVQWFACLATILCPLGYLVWVGFRSYQPPHEVVVLTAGILLPAAGALRWRLRTAA